MMNGIKRWRENAKLTQQELAALLGVTQGIISQWELGVSKPRVDKLPELARVLGCTIDDLYGTPKPEAVK